MNDWRDRFRYQAVGFSRVPPASKIAAAFRDVDDATARRIRRILKGKEDPCTVDATDAWVRQCYHAPRWQCQALHAADVLMGTHGVECLRSTDDQFTAWPAIEYLNAGDPYVATLVCEHDHDRITIAGWGDVLESYERRGVRFD